MKNSIACFSILFFFFFFSECFSQITCTPVNCTVSAGTLISFSGPAGGVSNNWDFDYTGPDTATCTGNILNGPSGANYTASGITASTTYNTPGTYIVVYRRQEFGPPFTTHWCTVVTVGQSSSLSLSTSLIHNTCFGLCAGQATVNVSGGSGSYTYIWDDSLSQSTKTATGLCAGNYSVIVTDTSGPIDTAFVTITEPAKLVLLMSPDTSICLGDNAMISTVATGGSGPYNYSWNNGLSGLSTHSVSPTIITNYQVTVSDSNNCSSMDAVLVSIISVTGTDIQTACDSFLWIDGNTYFANNNSASFNIVDGASNGCDSLVTLNLTINTVDITVSTTDPTITSNASGASYQWLDCNNAYAVIAGETAQSFTASTNGSYAVEVIANGCTDTSACVNILSIGISGNSLFNNVYFYPNPTSGIVNIDLANLKEVSIKVLDATGQLLYHEKNINTRSYQFEFEAPRGIYFLEVSSEKGTTRFKMVKE